LGSNDAVALLSQSGADRMKLLRSGITIAVWSRTDIAGKIAVSVKNEESLLKCVGACRRQALLPCPSRVLVVPSSKNQPLDGRVLQERPPELVSRLRLFEDLPLTSGE
jgi:hypothetical protein